MKTLTEWAIPLIANEPVVLIRMDLVAQLAKLTGVTYEELWEEVETQVK
jgi:hypothetical protein